jgi:hypothetical protein
MTDEEMTPQAVEQMAAEAEMQRKAQDFFNAMNKMRLAFPSTVPAPGGGTLSIHGMTLRQWYAGMALSSSNIHRDAPWVGARHCFAVADAMMELAEKETS